MIFGPINLLVYLLMTAVSLSVLGGGIYCVWGWYEGVLSGMGFLFTGIALLLFSFFGRSLMLLLLGRRRPDDSPYASPRGAVHRIARPNGSEIYVEQYGPESGPTLVFTHGLSFSQESWNYAKQELAGRFRIFVWDVPGFGRSRGPTRGAYTMETLAEDLEAVIARTGEEPVILIGHSMGGMIMLTFCRLFSQELGRRVAGLVLAQTSFTNPVKTSIAHRLLTALQGPLLTPLCLLMIGLSPLFRLMNLQSYLSGMTHLATHVTGYAGTETPAQLDFAARYAITSAPASTARALLALFRYDATDILAAIPVPTLVITGDHDIVTRPGAGEVMGSTIPKAQRAQLTPAGHLGLLEQHKGFCDTISTWASVCLSERRAPGSA